MELITVPKLSVILRKSYGLAVSNMGAGGNCDEVACWVTAEVSFMKPEFEAQIVYGASPNDPPAFQEVVAKMSQATTRHGQDLHRTRCHRSTRHTRVADSHVGSASHEYERRRGAAFDADLADEPFECA